MRISKFYTPSREYEIAVEATVTASRLIPLTLQLQDTGIRDYECWVLGIYHMSMQREWVKKSLSVPV